MCDVYVLCDCMNAFVWITVGQCLSILNIHSLQSGKIDENNYDNWY